MEASNTPLSLKGQGRARRRLVTNRVAELVATNTKCIHHVDESLSLHGLYIWATAGLSEKPTEGADASRPNNVKELERTE